MYITFLFVFPTQFPSSPKSTFALNPAVDESGFNAAETINKRARMGEPPTQFRPELVPFDYTDFTVLLAGAYATMQTSKNDTSPGIADIPFHEFNRRDGVNDAYAFSGDQEEAAGHKYGRIVGGLAMLEILLQYGLVSVDVSVSNAIATLNSQASTKQQRDDVFKTLAQRRAASQVDRTAAIGAASNIATLIGLWETDVSRQGVLLDVFANMYFNDLYEDGRVSRVKGDFETYCGGPELARKIVQQSNLANDHADNYKKARLLSSKYTEGALVGNWFSKTSQIIGRSMNSCAPGDTLHVLAGHFNL